MAVDRLLFSWGKMIREGRNQEFFQSLELQGLNLTEFPFFDPPLVVAAGAGNLEVVQGLLKLGADVNQRNSHGSSALHYAMRDNHPEVVSALLKAKADLFALSHHYTTPLGGTLNDENSAARERFLEHLRKTAQLKRVIDWELATWDIVYPEGLRRREILPGKKAKLKRFVPDWDGE